MSDAQKRTCLEEQMYGYLKALNFNFTEQYPFNNWVFDFLVQFKRQDGTTFSIDVETDGSNWHHTKSQRLRDLMRDKDTRTHGIEVVRFREGFNLHQVYGTIQQVSRRNGVTDFPEFPR